jgi:pimeloyl-ACP methyl ester carboxylesterase
MLHEGLGSASLWRDFPERLADAADARVLVYSRRGYGASSALDASRRVDYMHEEARIHLPALLAHFGIERPILFGHSDGASIALIQAAQQDTNARAVIVLAPHVKVEDLTVRSIEQARAAFETTDLRARLARHHEDVDGAFWGWNRIWLNPAFRSWNIEALLPKIHCPVLAIQGIDDEYGTLEQIDSIVRSVPGAEALTLADCRHSPHRDQPDQVLAATQQFLNTRIPQ